MATKITIDNTSGNINYESSPITPQIYDIAGELSGAPPVSTRVFDFKAVKAFTLKTGGVAGCVTAPSGGAVEFTIKKDATTIGTITFADGATSGTVSIASDVSVSIGEIINITSPANVYSIDTVFWTFNGIIS